MVWHVERSDYEELLKKCTKMDVGGVRSKGRQRKTCEKVVRGDMRELGLTKEMALDRISWRRAA